MATENGQRGGGRRPVDSKTRARIRKLARQGMSRNAIARECEVSPSTVTRVCAEAKPPISFDRTATAAATQAVVDDLKARRAEMAADVLDQARKVLDKFSAQHTVVGWYQGAAFEHVIDGPQSGDVKNYAIALGVLLDKHLVLVKHDSDDRDLPAVDQWLASMLGAARG